MKRSSVLGPRGRMGPAKPLATLPASQRPIAEEQITMTGKPAANMRTIRSLAPGKPATPKLSGVPDAARALKGLSLIGLLKKQPKYLLNSAEDVVVKVLKHKQTKGGMPAITGVTRDLKTKPMRPHKYQIIGLNRDNQKISTQKRIKVSCDCEWFCFYSEYALWTWGAANITYSNGQPAVVRNPGNHPLLCKHLTQVLQTIRKNNL